MEQRMSSVNIQVDSLLKIIGGIRVVAVGVLSQLHGIRRYIESQCRRSTEERNRKNFGYS